MRMKAYPIMSRIKGLKEVNTMLSSLRRYSQSEVAQQRMKIIKFYQQYGEEATKEAFGADRKVISCQVPQNLDTLSLSKYDGWNPKS